MVSAGLGTDVEVGIGLDASYEHDFEEEEVEPHSRDADRAEVLISGWQSGAGDRAVVDTHERRTLPAPAPAPMLAPAPVRLSPEDDFCGADGGMGTDFGVVRGGATGGSGGSVLDLGYRDRVAAGHR